MHLKEVKGILSAQNGMNLLLKINPNLWGPGTREKRIKSVVINLIVIKNKQCFHTKTPVPSP